MDTLKHIVDKWNLDLTRPMPIPIKISRYRTLLALFRDLGFSKGAEIGVHKGRYSRYICDRVPGIELFCVDPWLAYDDYVECKKDQEGMNYCYETTVRRLASYNCNVIRASSLDAVKYFDDYSLDFVFIDGNHSFRYVIDDIEEWSKKVRVGGIVSGHDYWNSYDLNNSWVQNATETDKNKLCQVKDAVDAWTKANKMNPWFITTGDKCSTFFWVKEKK